MMYSGAFMGALADYRHGVKRSYRHDRHIKLKPGYVSALSYIESTSVHAHLENIAIQLREISIFCILVHSSGYCAEYRLCEK